MKQRCKNDKIRPPLLLSLILLAVLPIAVFAAMYPDPGIGFYSDNNSQKPTLTVAALENDAYGRTLIVGTAFGEFEAVEITVSTAVADSDFRVVIAEWLAFTDARGSFVADWIPPFGNEKGQSYQISAAGSETKSFASIEFVTGELAAGADIDQCANGGVGLTPVPCLGAAWVNGNLNANKAHYIEGQVVPFRMRFTGLALGAHTVIVGFDTTENGKHAYDFLARYDYTETNADPCDSGATCTGASSTYPIPNDPNIAAAAPMNPPEFPAPDRYFTMWGGTITNVSTPVIASGDYTGSSRTEVSVTFTAAVANPVLSWGGHLARRGDWGNDASAAAIEGSPYHMRLIALDGSGGNQDRSIQSSAVIFPARITIYKHASPPSLFAFNFTATDLPLASFQLVDSSATTDAMQDFTGIQDFTLVRRVTELSPAPYTLRDITCTVTDVGGITGSYATIAPPQVDIFTKEAATVSCTFFNDFATAATIDLKGTVLGANGVGVRDAWVSLTNPVGVSVFTRTNGFGNYMFRDIEVGSSYFIEAHHKLYIYEPVMLNIGAEMKRVVLYPVK